MPVFEWEMTFLHFLQGLPHPESFDVLMKVLSDFDRTWWALLSLFPVLYFKWGAKRSLQIAAIMLLAVGVSDILSARILRASIMRPRPAFVGVNACDALRCWGFVSSHASNVFCGCILLAFFLPRFWRGPLFLVAVSVSFSRVYLGEHFPLDVLGGAALGSFVAMTIILLAQSYGKPRLTRSTGRFPGFPR